MSTFGKAKRRINEQGQWSNKFAQNIEVFTPLPWYIKKSIYAQEGRPGGKNVFPVKLRNQKG